MALTLRPLVEADVASGRLVMPFGTSLPSRYAYYLVIPEAISGRPAVQAFREWLLREVGVTMSAAIVKSPGDIITF
jgi:LysR family glycine cleavage system transcriptional activator